MKYTVVVDQFEEREIRPPELYDQYVSLILDEMPRLLGDPSGWRSCDCPACGSGDQSAAFEKNGFAYRRCHSCQSLFISPRPGQDALAAFRRRSRGERFWLDRIVSATAESRSRHVSSPRIEWIIDNALSAKVRPLVHLHVGPVYDLIPEILAQRGIFDRVLAACAGGGAAGMHEGDPDTIARADLSSLGTLPDNLALVSLFETLEGEHDPLATLTSLRAKLSPGGRILIATVNAGGFEIQMLRERARSVGLPSHLNLLSVRGVSTLLERSGFRVLELSTPGQLDAELVVKACRQDPTLALPAFLDGIVRSEDPSIVRHFQEFLQLARRSSHMRLVAEAA